MGCGFSRVEPQNRDQRESLCEEHIRKLTKYSETRNKLYCDQCISNDKALAAEVKNIKDYVQTEAFRLKQVNTEEDIASKKKHMLSLLKNVRCNKIDLETQKKKLIEKINRLKSKLIDGCDCLCERVTYECDDAYNYLTRIDKSNEDLLERLENLKSQESSEAVQNTSDAITLLNVINLEKHLSASFSQLPTHTVIDVQLKLHDNISLIEILNCEQTASSLGEITVPYKAESDETIFDNTDKIKDEPENTELAMKRDGSIKTMKMETTHNLNSTDSENTVYRRPQETYNFPDTYVVRKGPVPSMNPRFRRTSRLERNSNSQNRIEGGRESISRGYQSKQSNLSVHTLSSIGFGFDTQLNEKAFSERNAVLVKYVHLPGYSQACNISSSVILLSGKFIMCDKSNRKLLYLDDLFHLISDLGLDHEPHDICAINDEKVAVTFPKAKMIQIVKVTSDILATVSNTRTTPECWGIGCFGESLVFSTESSDVFHDVGEYKEYRWRKVPYMFQTPVHLTVNKDNLYVCNRGLDEVLGTLVVMRFDDRGEIKKLFSYSNGDLHRPSSCSLDCEENIYICDAESEAIHQVLPDGRNYRILDVKGGQKGHWQHINFIHDSDYFILTETNSKMVYVFQMQ